MEKDAQFIDPIMWSAFLLAFVLALLCIHGTAFRTRLNPWSSPSMLKNELRAVPLELEGQIDPSKSHVVKFVLNGEEKEMTVPEDMSLLDAAETLFDDVESSCRNGVCTTCAAKIVAGRENVVLAVHGLGEPQIEMVKSLT